ncbi:hypothetical protein HOY82DRAFT_537891 [Tuber indicum]|nr:hypothetical protein HOY82DRAFT_537891 [Tuber indicum]
MGGKITTLEGSTALTFGDLAYTVSLKERTFDIGFRDVTTGVSATTLQNRSMGLAYAPAPSPPMWLSDMSDVSHPIFTMHNLAVSESIWVNALLNSTRSIRHLACTICMEGLPQSQAYKNVLSSGSGVFIGCPELVDLEVGSGMSCRPQANVKEWIDVGGPVVEFRFAVDHGFYRKLCARLVLPPPIDCPWDCFGSASTSTVHWCDSGFTGEHFPDLTSVMTLCRETWLQISRLDKSVVMPHKSLPGQLKVGISSRGQTVTLAMGSLIGRYGPGGAYTPCWACALPCLQRDGLLSVSFARILIPLYSSTYQLNMGNPYRVPLAIGEEYTSVARDYRLEMHLTPYLLRLDD